MAEQNYDFQKRLLQVHRAGRRMEKPLAKGQLEITAAWSIVYPADNAFLADRAADLADYFAVSMGLSLPITDNAAGKRIVYEIDPELAREGAYRVDAADGLIRLIGKDERAAAQAGYLLEDLLNLEEAPYLAPGVTDRAPLFRCRMVHSGFAEDDFPDGHLNAIAHSGINTILVFVCGVNQTPMHELDFNDLIARAARYGIDVYAYSYMKTAMHPLDDGAEEYYDSLFGDLFRRCPGFKGIVFVGESVQFPSRDERTSGRMRTDNIDRFGNKIIKKPDPGWFPCNDYPDWLALVKKVIRREKADADIVFWTYNWGKCAEADRIALIDALPTDISLQATFEMFENFERKGVPSRSIDYTITFPGPGAYFVSEARAAKRRGIPLYSMTNAGGLTWDVGVVPYEPAPYQWLKRYDAMRTCHREYGLCGSMDCHHYGFYPSFISDLAKVLFNDENADGETVIDQLIRRDWGAENLDVVRQAYRDFSDALNDFIMTNEEQYGPLRIGPTYPLVLFGDHQLLLPGDPKAHHGGNLICFPNYAYPLHVPARREQFMGEIRLYKASAERMIGAAERLRVLLPALPTSKRDEAQRIVGVAEFMGRTALTVHHVKRWYLEKQGLLAADGAFERHLDTLLEIAAAERENVLATVPLTDFDSRLGFEPSMRYKGDSDKLRWKLAHLDRMVNEEIPALRAKGTVENPTRMDFPRDTWSYRFE